jgi:hypothetical protein
MEQISLNLTIEEINQILDALGQMPYTRVFQVIDKIKIQAEAQLRTQGSKPISPPSDS